MESESETSLFYVPAFQIINHTMQWPDVKSIKDVKVIKVQISVSHRKWETIDSLIWLACVSVSFLSHAISAESSIVLIQVSCVCFASPDETH